MKRRGPKIEPWGTPLVTFLVFGDRFVDFDLECTAGQLDIGRARPGGDLQRQKKQASK